MNKQRRAAIVVTQADLAKFREKIEEFHEFDNTCIKDESPAMYDAVIDPSGRIEDLRDEEQDYYDNMPESLQGGDKGSTAEAAIEALTTASDSLTKVANLLHTHATDVMKFTEEERAQFVDEMLEHIDEADSQLDQAVG